MTTPHETPLSAPRRGRRVASVKSLLLIALGVLNAALGLSLAGRMIAPNSAEATGQPGARVSEYVMIPSRPLGVNQDVLYIMDADNTRLVVAGYDSTARPPRIEFLGPFPLN